MSNMNTSLVLTLLATYNAPLVAIAAAINDNDAANKAASDASAGRKSTLTDAVKAYAITTAEDDADPEASRQALVMVLTTMQVKPGSVKACGNHFKGFRAMLDDGESIADATNKDAQDYVASDEVKAAKAARKSLNDKAKAAKYTAADWLALVELAFPSSATGDTDGTTTDSEANAVQAAASEAGSDDTRIEEVAESQAA